MCLKQDWLVLLSLSFFRRCSVEGTFVFLCFTRTGRERMQLVSTNHDRRVENLVTCALIRGRNWGSNLSVSPLATEVRFFEVDIQKKVQSHISQPHFHSLMTKQVLWPCRKQESTLPLVLHSLLTSWIVVTRDCCHWLWERFDYIYIYIFFDPIMNAELKSDTISQLPRHGDTDRHNLALVARLLASHPM